MLAQPQDAGHKTQLDQKRRIVDGRSKNVLKDGRVPQLGGISQNGSRQKYDGYQCETNGYRLIRPLTTSSTLSRKARGGVSFARCFWLLTWIALAKGLWAFQ